MACADCPARGAITFVLFRLLLAVSRRMTDPAGTVRMFLDAAALALGTLPGLVALTAASQAASKDPPLRPEIEHPVTLWLIVAMTWVPVRCTAAVGDLILRMHPAQEDR